MQHLSFWLYKYSFGSKSYVKSEILLLQAIESGISDPKRGFWKVCRRSCNQSRQ